ncbi:glutathione S-transferase family protein [bacterium AH-315-K03]|nr:glutathione S-transferase family protein [bacterium AH-315-K03]
MKLYQSMGPNPRVVNMFLAEKQLDVPRVELDLMGGENRQAAFLKLNPQGQSPALETDDGNIITEITAICEYLEELHAEPVLIGATPLERANTRLWCRRLDLNLIEPMANGFRYAEGLEIFKNRIHCIPHAADDLKATAQEKLTWLDGMMKDKEFIANDTFSLADILLYCFVDFAHRMGQPLNSDNSNIMAWYERVGARASAKESLHAHERG